MDFTKRIQRFNPYSAGIDFKVDPRTVKLKIFIMIVDPKHIGIQMNRRALTKTKWKKTFGLHGSLQKEFGASRVKVTFLHMTI